ncbi:Succinate dehydrogenase cytochrome b558 subunit [Phycisphaerae bacterium RAS1]|nr:Succinate dehydrogenase cytochrome b558 subunit [Phycisphaerae bacterium RAS1]
MPDIAEHWLRRNHFLLRRLHSLTGIIPVGVFLVNHLYTNSLAWLSPARFDEHVLWLGSLPYLIFVETLGIFAPLAFHAGYGVVIARTGQANVREYAYVDNWRYTLQRVTGWIALAFILIHLGHYRFAHWFGGTEFQHAVGAGASPFAITRSGMFGGMGATLWFGLYGIGLIASVFHLANGVCTFCITWGITVGMQSRRAVSAVAGALGLLLVTWGFLSLYGLGTRNAPPKSDGKAHAASAWRGEVSHG